MREECNQYSEENIKLQYDNYTFKNTLKAREEYIEELEMNNENLKTSVEMANKELE